MAYTLEPLNISHVKSIEALWLVDAEKQTPQASLGEDILNPFTEHFENTVTYGAFTNGHLVAAMKWGQRRRDAPIAELGNLHPGDGVIFWLFFTDEAGAEALLAQSRSTQTNRLYAFPECGDMARYTIFETGMLSLHRRRLVSFLEDYGFTIPAGADWGPQERIGFHRSLLDRVDIPPLPPGFHIELKQNDASCHLSLYTDLGERIGESTMGPARTKGAQVPHSFLYIGLAWRTPIVTEDSAKSCSSPKLNTPANKASPTCI